MKVIVTSNFIEIKVSDEDYDYLKQFPWTTDGTRHYAYRGVGNKHSRMHHEIALRMGWKFAMIDHKDRDVTNNQRENLRVATKSQNNCNVAKRVGSIYSDYKGVSYKKEHHKWFAQIQKNKNKVHIGYFDTEIEAALAYNRWALILHGEFAYLNEVH